MSLWFRCHCGSRPADERPFGAAHVKDVVAVTHNARGEPYFPHGGYICRKCRAAGALQCDGKEDRCIVEGDTCAWHGCRVRA